LTKTNHGMSSCRGPAAPPGSWWRRRRREESSPCSGPQTAGLPQPPNRLRRRCPHDPPRRRQPYPNPQTHQPRLRPPARGHEPKRRIQERPEPETQTQDDEMVGGSADASSSIPAAAGTAQSIRPGPLAGYHGACRWLVSRYTTISCGRRGPRRPPPPVAVRPAPLSTPNLLRGGGGVRSSLLRCFAGAGYFPRFFRFPQRVVGLGHAAATRSLSGAIPQKRRTGRSQSQQHGAAAAE